MYAGTARSQQFRSFTADFSDRLSGRGYGEGGEAELFDGLKAQYDTLIAQLHATQDQRMRRKIAAQIARIWDTKNTRTFASHFLRVVQARVSKDVFEMFCQEAAHNSHLDELPDRMPKQVGRALRRNRAGAKQ